MTKLKSGHQLLVVLIILIVPSIFYLLIRTGKNQYTTLEIFGPREAPAQVGGDTIYHTIGDFELVSHTGTPVVPAQFDGKILVTNFFFATCTTICPKMNMQMKRLQEKFKSDSLVALLSITVNPEHDSVPVLAAYAESYGAKYPQWTFATGDKKVIYDLARNGYFLTAMPGNGGPDDFIHSEKIVLIDKEKRIRGYYDGTDYLDVDRLAEDIQMLEFEYNNK
ncbi:MAG TPA: SCO family protein [Bacteroidia bacterium]|nr:SCO family protein [Bacteroidia bacterium]